MNWHPSIAWLLWLSDAATTVINGTLAGLGVGAGVGAVLSADVLADKQRGAIESQKPYIPLYDNLPQCLKDKVWEQGEK